MSTEAHKSPPYATYKTFINFIDGLRDHNLPPQIDRSLMKTLSGSVQSTLFSSLKSLDLITSDNLPTIRFKSIHGLHPESEEYKSLLLECIYKCYPFLSDGSLDIERATGYQLETKFRELGSSSSTLSKVYSFFISISQDAGLTLSNPILEHKPKAYVSKSKTRKKTKLEQPASTQQAKNNQSEPAKQHESASTAPAGTFSFEIPMLNKATARISLPKDMTQEEWKLIKTIIDAQATHLLGQSTDE